jgi:prephenate dehydratase
MKKVAIQGIVGSFHEDAAYKYFSDPVEIVECKTFTEVCETIDTDRVDFAVMAIENSIAGSILKNYQLIRDYHLRIIGEIYLHIQQNLLVIKGNKASNITDIYSHPVAIEQCIEYIEKYFPNAERHENVDTAASAKLVSEKQMKHGAAIGNLRSAELYNLEVLETGIETNKKNYTRFLILSKHRVSNSQANKASLCFEVGHFYGALARVLNTLAENKINLTKIQSVPVLGKPNEYSFHIDIEWENQENYDKAIHKVLKNASSLSILGEYVRGELSMHNQ